MTTGRINQVATNWSCVAFARRAPSKRQQTTFSFAGRAHARSTHLRGPIAAASSFERRLLPPYEGSLTGRSDSYRIYTRPIPKELSTVGTSGPHLPVTRKSLGRAASILPCTRKVSPYEHRLQYKYCFRFVKRLFLHI